MALNYFVAICNKIIEGEKVIHWNLNQSMEHQKPSSAEMHLYHTVIHATELKQEHI